MYLDQKTVRITYDLSDPGEIEVRGAVGISICKPTYRSGSFFHLHLVSMVLPQGGRQVDLATDLVRARIGQCSQ